MKAQHRSLLLFTFLSLLFFLPQTAFAVKSAPQKAAKSTISAEDGLQKEGKIKRFFQKQEAKLMQTKFMKKMEAEAAARGYDFNIGGFLLGFFLGPIGILIALLFGRDAFRSSITGFLVSLLIVVIAALLGR